MGNHAETASAGGGIMAGHYFYCNRKNRDVGEWYESLDSGLRLEIVVSLLIADGVKSRGHRKNIMSKDFKTTGIGFAAQHKKYGCECVLDFADDFIEKE